MDDLMQRAREAGFDPRYCSEDFDITKFAQLVAKQAVEAEREACGRIADRMAPYTGTAAAIRARQTL